MVLILSMLFRAKKLILISFMIVFALVLVYLLIKPEIYEAHMSLLLRNERAEPLVGADPHQNTIQLPDVTEVNLNSEVELLSSSEVLQQVVVNCGLARGMRGKQDAAIESATRRLSRGLKITPVRNSSLINVSYESSNREQASAVLSQLAKVYLAKRMNLHTATQASSFFEDQSQRSQNALRAAEDERASFLTENGDEGLPQQMQMSLQYVQELKGQVNGVQASLDETEGRIRQIAADRSATERRISTQQRTASNPYAVQQLMGTLVTLENRKTELLTKFRASDRQVVQADRELQNTRDALTRVETMQPLESVSDANPAWQAMDAESDRLRQAKGGLLSRKAELMAQFSQQMDRVRRMESDSVRASDLDRKVRVAADKFDLYESKAVAAKIGDDLDAQHISNVVLASEPMVPVLPAPSRINLFTGLLLAIFVSVSIGFLSEVVSSKLYGPTAVEEATGVPVMATVPDGLERYSVAR